MEEILDAKESIAHIIGVGGTAIDYHDIAKNIKDEYTWLNLSLYLGCKMVSRIRHCLLVQSQKQEQSCVDSMY